MIEDFSRSRAYGKPVADQAGRLRGPGKSACRRKREAATTNFTSAIFSPTTTARGSKPELDHVLAGRDAHGTQTRSRHGNNQPYLPSIVAFHPLS